MNKALEVVEKEVKQCVRQPQMQELFDDHSLVQEALCAENCTARWIWKTGDLHSAGQIPWESQSINTCPENFLWEKNKSVVVLVAPGLY